MLPTLLSWNHQQLIIELNLDDFSEELERSRDADFGLNA